MFEAILKDRMIEWVESQASTCTRSGSNWTWWQFKDNSKMMLKNECLCMVFSYAHLKMIQFLSLIVAQMMGWKFEQMEVESFRWAWNGSGAKLLASIAPNKIWQSSCKNLKCNYWGWQAPSFSSTLLRW